MLFGRIRWYKRLGGPVGDASTGFRVLAEEHTVTRFRVGPSGPEPEPGTGIWKPAVTVPCRVAPDEGDMHVVAFNVPDVHLSGFPDGKYRVKAELTGNWSESLLHLRLGFRRIEPVAFQVSLTKDHHLVSLDFEVILEPYRWHP
jgi:hypothetical protein